MKGGVKKYGKEKSSQENSEEKEEIVYKEKLL